MMPSWRTPMTLKLRRIRTSALLSVCTVAICLGTLCVAPSLANGQSAKASTAAVPTLVHFSGVLNGVDGTPLTSLTGVTFSLYAQSQGGAPLWLETQSVQRSEERRVGKECR